MPVPRRKITFMMPNGLWWRHPAKRSVAPGSTQAPQSVAIIRADMAFFARWSWSGLTRFTAHDQHRAGRVMHAILACLTAQRSAVRDDGEPSTPTTIRGAPFVIAADIRTRSLHVIHPAPEGHDHM